MQDAHAARPTLLVCLDEFLETSLKPGCHHAPVGMPDGTEAIPQPRIAPHRPVLDEFTYDASVVLDAHAQCPRSMFIVIGFWENQTAGTTSATMVRSAVDLKPDQISRPSTFSRSVL